MKKIVVVGAGAIGGIVGGLLSRAGEDVTLIGRKPHIDTINKEGLFIDGVLGEMRVKVKAAEHLDFRPDLVLLAVKTQDVESAAREIEPYVSAVPIVTMQNGVRSDDMLADVVGRANIISCVVLFGGTFLEPGKITISNYSKRGSLLLGEAFGPNGKKLERVAAILNKALPARVVKDVRRAHWTKLIANLNNAIPAITGLSIQEMGNHQELNMLSVLLMKEGLHVVELAGIEPVSLPGLPISIVKIILNMPLPVASSALRLISRSLGNVPIPGSTLQSIRRRKATEIDYLNGEIVTLADKIDVPAPRNTAIVNIVHRVEAEVEFLTAVELLAAVEKQSVS